MSSGEPPRELREVLEIRNEKGLHARAAVLFVETAKLYDAELTVTKDGQSVNGRSIMGIMTLAAEQGSHIEVSATGPQADEALAAIRALVDERFHEGA
jgi:phosphocarrier protein